MLGQEQVRRFIEAGFIRIEGAVPREIADTGRAALWGAIGCDPHDPATWTRPVIRIGPSNDQHGDQPLSFRAAANTPISMRHGTPWWGRDGGNHVRTSARL